MNRGALLPPGLSVRTPIMGAGTLVFCCQSAYIGPVQFAAVPFRTRLRALPKDIRQLDLNRVTSREYALEKKMPTGTVKWFNGQKGFGFIQPTDGGSDVFVHISAVERAGLPGLAEGQKVKFELKTDKMRGKVSAEDLSLA